MALGSVDDQARTGGIVNRQLTELDIAERQGMLEETREVLRRVAEYPEVTSMVQRVSDHPAQRIALQKEITELTCQRFIPPQCDHTEIENQILPLTAKRDKARRRPAAPRTDEER